ncbi:aspartic protease 2, partial [Aphelenchoides avenae]
KWAEYQDRKSAVQSTRLASSSQPLIDYDDGEYIANVSIGTPPQRFIVLLTLSSGAFWVPDKACPNSDCPSYCNDAVYCKSLCDPRCCNVKKEELVSSNLDTFGDCGWRSRFDSRKSSSYRKNGTQFEDVFSGDADADGFIGVDTVTLGGISGLKVPLQTFGQATSADFSDDDVFDGFLPLPETLGGVF